MKLKPYHEYKDSGVPWLGEIPEHWQALPNRALFAEVNDRNHPDEPLLSVTIGRGVISQSGLLANSSKKDSSNENKANYKLVRRRYSAAADASTTYRITPAPYPVDTALP